MMMMMNCDTFHKVLFFLFACKYSLLSFTNKQIIIFSTQIITIYNYSELYIYQMKQKDYFLQDLQLCSSIRPFGFPLITSIAAS